MNKYVYPILPLLLGSCSLSPDFTMPQMDVPQQYANQLDNLTPLLDDEEKGKWKIAEPSEELDRGEWWKIFADEQLNTLEAEAILANQSLKAAAARLEQARAIANQARGDFFPTISGGANAQRSKPSGVNAVAFGAPPGTQIKPYTSYGVNAGISYEVDLFGRVRDSVRAANYGADAEAALYNSALLALQADVAQAYFRIRALDAERNILASEIKLREEGARIMKKRFDVGDVGEQDYASAESELATVRAQSIAIEKMRVQAQNMLAVLTGQMPQNFKLEAKEQFNLLPPKIPADLPSTLLERRPDIVSAQNQMQAANANIGVARSAFFPSINLTASGGYESLELSDLFKWSGRTWALGPLGGNIINIPIFAGGRNFAYLERTKATYAEAVANYQQRVLVAFQEVEDNLVAQKMMAEQSVQQDIAAKRAKRSAELTRLRYKEGEISYFELLDTERNALQQERAAVQLRGDRLATTVTLIRALGGGWAQTPSIPPAAFMNE